MKPKHYAILGGGFVGGLVVGILAGRAREKNRVRELVAAYADRFGAPVTWSLAFADRESHFNPEARGDFDWPHRECRAGAGCYAHDVLENPIYAENPYRDERDIWISYGVFQLLSPYQLAHAIEARLLPPDASPEELLDLDVNLTLGVQNVLALYRETDGDFIEARLRAAGCHDCGRYEIIVEHAIETAARWSIDTSGSVHAA